MGQLDGRIAWVTGAGTGIGRAGAIALAGEGAHVVLSSRTETTLRETERLIVAAGGSCELGRLDVADQAAVATLAASILTRHGKVDILVNSAGLNIPRRSWAQVEVSGWSEVVDINLNGTFYCCHAVMASMRERGEGTIINVSSWLGKHVSPLGGPSYTASKFGASALTESINAEEGKNGIRACCIAPGEAATPIMDRRPVKPPQLELDRMLQEDDLGRAILFVATMPARVCINDMIVTPTYNRFYAGGLETTTRPAGT